jgi:hypothetical protein
VRGFVWALALNRNEEREAMENEDIGAKDFRFSFGVMAVIGIIAIAMMLFS